jgi:hypothetical protein
MLYGVWEWHPLYGSYSRIIYKQIRKDTYIIYGREYAWN